MNKKYLSLIILTLVGLITTIKLAMIYYSANFDMYSLPSFCSVSEFVDCDGVAKSTYSQFLGIPLAYWGLFLYTTVLFLLFVDKLKNVKFLKFLEVFKNPYAYISTLGSISFLVSIILASISLFLIKKLCILCVFTYIIDLVIATIAADGMFKNIVKNFKTTIIDFIDGAKKYTKTFVVLVLLFAGFLCYSGITLNFVPHIKKMQSIKKYAKMKKNPYAINGNTLGNPKAEITIELYSDYVCPLCYINNIMLHKAAKEFKNIKIVHYNYPFDKECNGHININLHPNACFMARVAISSRNQNNYWGMGSLLYEKHPKNIDELSKIVNKLNLDNEKLYKDISSTETEQKLKEDIERAVSKEIDATPTMIINGEKFVGVKPYYNLQKILIEHGAKRK